MKKTNKRVYVKKSVKRTQRKPSIRKKRQKTVISRRTYAAAKVSRLNSSWITANLTSDNELRRSLRLLRSRSRDLEQNNDYVKKYFNMLITNVIGPRGIVLQNKAMNREGVLDTVLNNKIEKSFRMWGKKKNCSVDGTMSWVDIQKIFIKSIARDGEILIRKVKGFDNPFGFALQVIEADHLDENYNEEFTDGRRIVMSVEKDIWGRPAAYHLLTRHPGDYSYVHTRTNRVYDRVPADEIIHAFVKDRSTQSRGIPWMHTAIIRLNMVGGTEEAELVATRASACKMGIITSPTGTEYTGDDKDSKGNIITEAEPGTFEQLPQGMDIKTYDPQHPNSNMPAFMKFMLRGAASGMNVSYNSLSSDREGVNFSSLRHGEIQDRDAWKVIQYWVIEHFCEDVVRAWVPMAILTGQLEAPADEMDRILQPSFQPRGFDWIDPEKDITADIMAIKNGMKTLTQVIAERGRDIEEVFIELSRERELMKKYGLQIDFSASKSDSSNQNDGKNTCKQNQNAIDSNK